VLAEPFARPKPPGKDETIFEFATRRIGREAAEVLVGSMVSGVFAGDIRELSLSSAFPKMAAMEEEHGSLVRAMIARARERRAAARTERLGEGGGEGGAGSARIGGPAGPGGTLTSFRNGLETLPTALAEELGHRIRCGIAVVRVRRTADGEGGGAREGGASARPWVLDLSDGREVQADAVVLAVPASRAEAILAGLDTIVAAEMDAFPTAGLAVVALGYDAENAGGHPDGFGFLVPRKAGPRILGCLWDSSIFPGRAPTGKVLLRVMIGGAHDPTAVDEDASGLTQIARKDLSTAMGLEAEPSLVRVFRWPLGIGQYTVGHGERVRSIERRLEEHGGIWVAGSSFHGISMNACIEKAASQATEILEFLATRPGP
jgi:oxygen-dependent protoporphyrinogen oxidase